MPGFPSQLPVLSFRPKNISDASSPYQSSACGQPHDTTAAHNHSAARLSSDYTVDQQQVFRDVARLAARGSHQHVPTQDMDVEEARRLIELEHSNARARSDFYIGQQFSTQPKGRGRGKVNNHRSVSDGLDDLERLFAMATHHEQLPKSHPEEDGLDELNHAINTTEASVDKIAGEMDVEFGGMRDALANEMEWSSSSDAQRAALEKAMLAARSHGDYISQFDPQAFERLASIQQQLFQAIEKGYGSPGASNDSRQYGESVSSREMRWRGT